MLLHIVATSGYCDARSLIPGTTFRPAQTGQPVVPLPTERTTLQIAASNFCLQSGQTNVSFLPLPVVTSKARCLSFSLSIAATFGQATARQFSLMLYGILMPRVGTVVQAVQLQVVVCITFIKAFIIFLFLLVTFEACNKKAATIPLLEEDDSCYIHIHKPTSYQMAFYYSSVVF